jgi:quinol monooxygenase YgiN
MEPAMHIQIVNFQLRDVSDARFRELCDELAPAFADVPGLVSKVWLANPATNTYGGVYTWASREAMHDYARSDLFQGVATNPSFADVTATDFEILDGPTGVTHGLTAPRAAAM